MPGSTATEDWPRPLEFGLRLILAYVPLIWLAHRHGRDVVEAFLPLLRTLLYLLDDSNRIRTLSIGNNGFDTTLLMRAFFPHDMVIDGKTYLASKSLFVIRMGTGLVLQPALVALGLILAWPWRRVVELPFRFVAATLMLLLVLVIDAPLTMWATYLQASAPESKSTLWQWQEFMAQGGRLALGLLIALAAIKFAGNFSRRQRSAIPVAA